MHLNNTALLKIAEPGRDKFHSIRIAPLYDAVTTRVFPRLERDHMALKLNGKDDKLRRIDFRTFAGTAGLKAADADAAIDGLLGQMRQAIDHTALPVLADYGPNGKHLAERMLEIVRLRLSSFA